MATTQKRPKRPRIEASETDINEAFERIEQECDTATAESFNEWMTYKKERGESYTPTGLRAMASMICKQWLYGYDVSWAITRAMSQGWQGFDHSGNWMRRTT